MRRIGIGMIRAAAEARRVLAVIENYAESFVPAIADFCAAVRGEKEPFMSGLEGFRDLAVVDAARRSIRSGCAEAVEEF